MIAKQTTAAEMARTVGIKPDVVRDALLSSKCARRRSTDWEVKIHSPAYSVMRTVLAGLLRRKVA